MDQAALLDALARALGTPDRPVSDYRIAKELGYSRQQISMIRSGTRFLDEDHAARLAQLAGLNSAYVAAVIAEQRAKTADAKRIYRRDAMKIGAAALTVLLAVQVALLAGVEIAQPNQLAAMFLVFAGNIHYTHVLAALTLALALWSIGRGRACAQLRRLVAIAALATLCTAPARAAEPWSSSDAALGAAALTLTIIDWRQTRTIAKHPELYYEQNPILGHHPSVGKVDTYFAVAMIGSTVIAHALPSTKRKAFLGVVTSLELFAVLHNRQVGIRADF